MITRRLNITLTKFVLIYLNTERAYRVCKLRTRLDPEIAMLNSIVCHPNAVPSNNIAAKHCTVVHKARYVLLLGVARFNHFRVHNLQKSRDILTDPSKYFKCN